jgi:C-terminal processing protease CtpA/Prc
MLSDEIGLLKVAMFPGAIGIDVAKDIDRGIAALNGCSRIIVDLRGNTGGGIGGLRLMSWMVSCADSPAEKFSSSGGRISRWPAPSNKSPGLIPAKYAGPPLCTS